MDFSSSSSLAEVVRVVQEEHCMVIFVQDDGDDRRRRPLSPLRRFAMRERRRVTTYFPPPARQFGDMQPEHRARGLGKDLWQFLTNIFAALLAPLLSSAVATIDDRHVHPPTLLLALATVVSSASVLANMGLRGRHPHAANALERLSELSTILVLATATWIVLDIACAAGVSLFFHRQQMRRGSR